LPLVLLLYSSQIPFASVTAAGLFEFSMNIPDNQLRLLGWTTDTWKNLYPHQTSQSYKGSGKHPRSEWDSNPTSVFEWLKTIRALNGTATVIGTAYWMNYYLKHTTCRRLDSVFWWHLLSWGQSTYLQTCESESYVTTDGQSASLSSNKAPICGLRPDFYCCQTVAGLLV
jgi:hypothetical protein